MAKGYWIAGVDINTQADYDEYRKRNALAFANFGGKFLVRGGSYHCVLGEARVFGLLGLVDLRLGGLGLFRLHRRQLDFLHQHSRRDDGGRHARCDR